MAAMGTNEINSINGSRDPWWMRALQQFGLPTALLLVIIWGCWSIISWTGTEVVKPMVAQQMVFIDKLQSSVVKMAEAMEATAEAHKQLVTQLTQTTDRLDSMLDRMPLREGDK